MRPKSSSSRVGGIEAKRFADAIASASQAAVERHAKLGEVIATIRDGDVEVVPAATVLERWQRVDARGGRNSRQKRIGRRK